MTEPFLAVARVANARVLLEFGGHAVLTTGTSMESGAVNHDQH
ncbi:MAG: hypothetical protein WBP61_11240 [Nocardioides sp.]